MTPAQDACSIYGIQIKLTWRKIYNFDYAGTMWSFNQYKMLWDKISGSPFACMHWLHSYSDMFDKCSDILSIYPQINRNMD